MRVAVLAAAVAISVGQTCQPPFSVAIRPPESTVQAGSDVGIAVTNTTDHDIWFGTTVAKGQGEQEFDIRVHDSEGKEPTETEYGLRLHGKSKSAVRGPGSVKAVQLKPGQTYQYYSILNRVYDLTPGTYTIQASRRDSENKAGVKSNTFTVTVSK